MNHAIAYVIDGLVNVGLRPSLHEIHKVFNYVPADSVTTLHEDLMTQTSNRVTDNLQPHLSRSESRAMLKKDIQSLH